MSDRLTDLVGSLVRRLAGHLNRKVSDIVILLFNRKSAGSLGAVAGFAIAVVFAWKFLRPRRNRPKHRSPPPGGSSIHGNAVDAAAAAAASVAEAYAPEVELSLGQIVRRKLGGYRKMTCQLLGVILEEKTPEDLQKHATVRQSVVEVLLEITQFCDLYLMETVLDDDSEERVLLALENAGLFQTSRLNKDKVLFCSTENGRSSFVRQLEVDLHVDSNLEVVSQLSRFIRNQLYISTTNLGQIATNVFSSTSLEQYLSYI